jgi:hypothetical protein
MPLILGANSVRGAAVHQIDQSIRFNAADSAYMQRTYGAGGNVDASTISFWFKRSKLGVEVTMFGSGANTSNTFDIFFKTDDTLFIQDYAGAYTLYLGTTQVFRDPSAWYHLVFAYDSANAIETERARLYINGQRVTSFGGASPSPKYPSQNADSILGTNVAIGFGRYISLGSSNTSQYFDGYLAEMNYVNGLALDPSYFGETNDNGIWIPKEYSGSYGTGGFFVDGRDASDLGDDESGSGNDLTTSGLASHDQMADSPTNNFCVMNPLNTHSSITLSNGNLQSTASAFTGSGASILLPSTGKWYAEIRYNNASVGEYPMVGIYNTIKNLSTSGLNPGNTSGDKDIGFGADGIRRENATDTSSWGNAVGDGKIGAFAIDMDNKKIWFGHNNSGSFVWQASGNPSAGSNEANTIAFADDVIFGNSHYGGSIVCWNFGQDGTFGGTETAQGNADGNGVGNFYYAPPTNYLALCTKNIGS